MKKEEKTLSLAFIYIALFPPLYVSLCRAVPCDPASNKVEQSSKLIRM